MGGYLLLGETVANICEVANILRILLVHGSIKDDFREIAVYACRMLARQATLACQRALNEFAARAAAQAAVSNTPRNLRTCTKNANPKVLITGGLGQLGMPLARVLR